MSHALATVQHVAAHRAMGIVTRRRRVPRQRFPRLIELEYAKAITAIVDATRAAFAPLLEALPRLLAQAAAERADGSTDDARSLIEQARDRLNASLNGRALDDLARRYADRTAANNREQIRRQAKAALGVDVYVADRSLPAMITHFAAENVSLIKAIPSSMADEIEKAATRAISSGTRHEDLAAEIQERFSVGESRARLIARDQIGKLYGQVNASRQQALGVTSFVWRTVHDERVRSEHAELDGQTFRYDDPPSEGLPGEAIQCRCSADPDFTSIDGLEDDATAPTV